MIIHMRRARRYGIWALAAGILAGCTPTPPMPPAPERAEAVRASFGKTWDAAIDVFASNDISIATMDRASGLLVPAGTSAIAPTPDSARTFADCGRAMGMPLAPTSAHYNVVVRGDSTASTVLVRAFYINGIEAAATNCSTTGRFERAMEDAIRARAEAR